MNFNQDTFFKTYNLPKIEFFSKLKTTGFKSPTEEHEARANFVSEFGNEIPNQFLINKIKYFVQNDIVLELGAGLGLWAAYLKQQMIKIFPVDPKMNEKAYCSILEGSAEKVLNILKTNVLFISHPQLNSAEFLDAIKHYTGQKLIFIGNEIPNCDKLLTEYIFRKFYVKEKYQIQGFGQHRNTLFLMKRK